MIRALVERLAGGFAGQAAIYIGAAILNAAIPFLLLPLIARWLGPADFGVIGSFVAIANVLILLVGLNAYGFVSVAYYRDGAQTLPRVVGAAVAIILAATVCIGLAGWGASGEIERLTQIDRDWLWTILAAAAGQAVLAIGLTTAQTTRRPIIYAIFQIGYGLSLSLLALLLVGVVDMGWHGRALAQALAAIGLATAALAWLRTTGQITMAFGRATLRRALLFGVPLLPHSFAAVAMGSMDRLALGHSYTPSVVGEYFLALQISSLFTAIAAAVNQAWVPWLYERLARGDAGARVEISRVIRGGGALLTAAAATMAVLASPLSLFVGGAAFHAAAIPLRILAFYAAFQAWYTLMSAFLFYADRIKLMSALTTSVAAIQAIAIVLCVRWGAAGVASALLISAAIGAIMISLIVRWLFINGQLPARVTDGAETAATDAAPQVA